MSDDIYLVRHAETENAKKGIVDGRYSDSELSHKGIDQARVLGDTFRRWMPGMIISSDSGRAVRTVEIMRTQLFQPITHYKTELLRERGFGSLEGKCSKSEGISEKNAPLFYAADSAFYNPESLNSVRFRVEGFLCQLLAMARGDPIVIVGHNWMNSYITNRLLRHNTIPETFFPLPNCGIRRFQMNGNAPSLKDVTEYYPPESIDEMIFSD